MKKPVLMCLPSRLNYPLDAFNQLMAATDRQAAGADAQLAYQNALIDAHKREALALNEVSKQRALAEADTEDARGVVEQKFARTAQAITAGFDDKRVQPNVNGWRI